MRRHRSRSARRAFIRSEISAPSKIARGKRKRRKQVSGGKTIMRILPAGCGTFSLLNHRGFPFCSTYTEALATPAPPDRIRPSSSPNNCRSWRPSRQSTNSASASSRCGGPRGQVAWPASRKCRLCQKYLLDLWSRVPYKRYNTISRSEKVIPTLLFPFAIVVDTLRTKSIPFHPLIHHPFLALLSSRYVSFGFLIYYNRFPFLCFMI